MCYQIDRAKYSGKLSIFFLSLLISGILAFDAISLSTNQIEKSFIDNFTDKTKIDKYEGLTIDTNQGNIRLTRNPYNKIPYSTFPQILESVSFDSETENPTWDSINWEEKLTGKTSLYVQVNLSSDHKTWDGWLRKGMVSFSFDDGYSSTYNVAFPMLQKYGFTGVIYVINSSVYSGEARNKSYVTLSMLHTLENAGWEIGGHTKSHKILTALSDDELKDEIAESYTYLKGKGFKVTGMAYPYGIFDQRVINVASDYFEYARGFIGFDTATFDYPVYGKYALPWVSGDDSLSNLKNLVDIAESHNKWVIFTFHQIKTNDSKLESLLQYVKSKNVDVVTIADGMSRMNSKGNLSKVASANKRYAKYRAIFCSSDGKDTPTLSKVMLNVRINTEKPAWDVNGDGQINEDDIKIAFQHFGETLPSSSENMPDINKDGIVNILDLILITKHIVSGQSD
jgi:peptidoglycan/xylan/chitin deacetylase (PgdA/CDA1 family)